MTVFAGIAVPFYRVVDSSARDGWQFSPVQQGGSKVAAVHWSPSIGFVSVIRRQTVKDLSVKYGLLLVWSQIIDN